MKQSVKILSVLVALAMFPAAPSHAQQTRNADVAEAEYSRTIGERSDKIVATLGITNSVGAKKVQAIIVQQYRDLREIQDRRNAQVKAVKAKAEGGREAADAAAKAIQDTARTNIDKLHDKYLAKLNAELTPEQVDKVKDGMTYGVLEVTYNAYLKMFPELTEEQKAQIKTWLVEAREIAMDGGSSNEKHAVFGKYKGRINNYLSKAGYDLKKGEENLRKTSVPAPDSK